LELLPASVINDDRSVLGDVEPVIVGILGPDQLKLLRVKTGNGDDQLFFFCSRSGQVSCIEEDISSIISLISFIHAHMIKTNQQRFHAPSRD